MQNIKIDFITNKIIVTKGFYESAVIPATEENAQLNTVLRDYPNMTVSVRETSRKSKPNAYKGLTYRYMRKFISIMDRGNLERFEQVVLAYEGLYSENATVFAKVRDWFLITYPRHEEMLVEAMTVPTPALVSIPVVEELAPVA